MLYISTDDNDEYKININDLSYIIYFIFLLEDLNKQKHV